jgi:pSer/pThr/pTyr-binding forkhead associated (FHA) protein
MSDLPAGARAVVTVLEGGSKGAELVLTDRPSYVIGRSEGCDLQIGDRSVSREHSRIEFDGQYFWLVDCASANGTRVNEEPVRRYMLHEGDVIRTGRVSMVFRRARGSGGSASTKDIPERPREPL